MKRLNAAFLVNGISDGLKSIKIDTCHLGFGAICDESQLWKDLNFYWTLYSGSGNANGSGNTELLEIGGVLRAPYCHGNGDDEIGYRNKNHAEHGDNVSDENYGNKGVYYTVQHLEEWIAMGGKKCR